MPYFAINMCQTQHTNEQEISGGSACQCLCWDIGIAIWSQKKQVSDGEFWTTLYQPLNVGNNFIVGEFLFSSLATRMHFNSILWKREKNNLFSCSKIYFHTSVENNL